MTATSGKATATPSTGAEDLHVCSPQPAVLPCADGKHFVWIKTRCCKYCGKTLENIVNDERWP